MSEFGETLLGDISKTWNRKMKRDRSLRSLANRVRDGTSYHDAEEFAVRVAELLGDSINENTKTLAYMSEGVANEVLVPLLFDDYKLVSEASTTVQTNMYNANELGLASLEAEFDTNRAEGLVIKVANSSTFDEARVWLGEPIINFSQAVADETMQKNMSRDARLGLTVVLERKLGSSETRRRRKKNGKLGSKYEVPCDWCRGLAGTYDYESHKKTGDEVFRRHVGCRCTLTYINGKQRQDSWYKTKWTVEDGDEQKGLVKAQQIRQEKLQEDQRKAALKAVEQKKRAQDIEKVQYALGFDPATAAKWYNTHKADIEVNGLAPMLAWEYENRTFDVKKFDAIQAAKKARKSLS